MWDLSLQHLDSLVWSLSLFGCLLSWLQHEGSFLVVQRPLLWPPGSVVAAQLLQSMWRNFFPLSLGNLISPGEGKQAAAESAKNPRCGWGGFCAVLGVNEESSFYLMKLLWGFYKITKSLCSWEKTWQPLQYFCWENPMGREAWQVTVHGVTKSQTWLKKLSMHPSNHFDAHLTLTKYCKSATCSVVQSCLTLCWCFGLSPARFPCWWDFAGKNSRGGCHLPLEGSFLTQGSSLHLLCLSLALAGGFFTAKL